MNWGNYRRLVRHLETIPATKFHYGKNDLAQDECGCAAWHCVRTLAVTGQATEVPYELAGSTDFQHFLDVSFVEASYLFGMEARSDDEWPEAGCKRVWRLTGEEGRREALRRLAVVAARYGVDPAEATFLTACKAGVAVPLTAEELVGVE